MGFENTGWVPVLSRTNLKPRDDLKLLKLVMGRVSTNGHDANQSYRKKGYYKIRNDR